MVEQKFEGSFFAHPVMGTLLTLASAVSFLFLCMILPIVGPAAVHGSGSPGAGPVPHLTQNKIAFAAVLLLSLALAVLSIFSKLERRKIDSSPLPYATFGLAGILIFILLIFVTGLTAI